MPTFIETGRSVTLRDQLQGEGGPVVLINTFVSDGSDDDGILKAWAADAAIMKRQPGYISTQIHRGIAGSGVFVNYAVWETIPLYRAALDALREHAHGVEYPQGVTSSPHLFETVAVPGICIA